MENKFVLRQKNNQSIIFANEIFIWFLLFIMLYRFINLEYIWRGVVHKLRWQNFDFFWPSTPLRWHFLPPYECWQKVDLFGSPTPSSCERSLWTAPEADKLNVHFARQHHAFIIYEPILAKVPNKPAWPMSYFFKYIHLACCFYIKKWKILPTLPAY